MLKEGLPWITEYSVLKNKRYILTNSQGPDTDKKVQLWSMETGTVVKTWKQKTFQQVQKIIAEEYDLNNIKDDKVKLPLSWFSADIKLGVSIFFATFLPI